MKFPKFYALHEAGLRNGSVFIQRNKSFVAEYINGDYMGSCDSVPALYAGCPLMEFDSATAKRLLPKCCGGKQ